MLPHGTVTFLFTDVEGSTRLLHELGDEYANVLGEHRRVLREAFARHGGVEVDTQGDAFFVAFAKASDALAAAADGRAGLADGPIRVRMGLHTGEPVVTDEGYVGIDVHRAARIAAAGHGGQILVSQSTRELTGGDGLRDLGEHRLKDMAAPERIYQLGDGDFPPLKSLNNSNLPLPAEPLVGRKKELADVLRLLRDSCRLVTVTGPGGTGKTRFALEAASELVESFRDGVWWVGLAAVRDEQLVLPTIGTTLGVKEDLLNELRGKELLLLLDNFEHLVDGAKGVAELQNACPGVAAIVTSREPLHIAGEREYLLAPLPEAPAVELFRQRAEAVAPELDADYETLVAVCDRLDRLPLAIELAAARTKALQVEDLLRRLDERLPLLTSRRRDVEERQRTLRATIEWSYELLDDADREQFAALSVFVGSFAADAAEAVCGADLDALESLLDKSLLQRREDGRFFFLETIREYAANRLDASPEAEDLRRRHLEYFRDLVVELEPQLVPGVREAAAYATLTLEEANVRAALTYACERSDAESALMIAGSNWRFWSMRVQLNEAVHEYERALAVPGESSPRARGRSLYGLSEMEQHRGNFDRARSLLDEALPLLRAADETRWLISAMNHVGTAHLGAGDTAAARTAFEETLVLAQRTGDERAVAMVTGNLGYLAILDGREDDAESLLTTACELDKAAGRSLGVAGTLVNLALLSLRRGDARTGGRQAAESLRLFRAGPGDGATLEALLLAAVALQGRDPGGAVRVHAAARALAAAAEYDLSAGELELAEAGAVELRTEMGDPDFSREWSIGEQLDQEAAVTLALESLD